MDAEIRFFMTDADEKEFLAVVNKNVDQIINTDTVQLTVLRTVLITTSNAF